MDTEGPGVATGPSFRGLVTPGPCSTSESVSLFVGAVVFICEEAVVSGTVAYEGCYKDVLFL